MNLRDNVSRNSGAVQRVISLWGIAFCGFLLSSAVQNGTAVGMVGSAVLFGAALGLGLALRRLPLAEALVLAGIAGYVVLNRGFAYVNIQTPMGSPVFIGEILLFAVVLAVAQRGYIMDFLRTPVAPYLVGFFLYGVLMAWVSLFLPGRLSIDRLKDAAFVIYPLFFIFGYMIARSEWEALVSTFGVAFCLLLPYSFLFPYDRVVQLISPEIYPQLPIFGHFNTAYVHVVGGLFFFLFVVGARCKEEWPKRAVRWGGAALFGVSLLMMQLRAGLLALAASVMVYWWMGFREHLKRAASILILVWVLIISIPYISGFEIRGWKGPVTVDFLWELFLSIFGLETGKYSDAGLLASRESRLQMWTQSLEPSVRSVAQFVFGRGFGEPLVEVELVTGWTKRSPHNSFVTVFARLGVIGLSLLIAVLGMVMARMLRVVKRVATMDNAQSGTFLWLLGYLVAAFVGATFSVVFDTPYMAAPVWTLLGFAYGFAEGVER